MNWSQLFSQTLILGALQFLVGLWLRARLEKSIQHEYDKRLADYRHLHDEQLAALNTEHQRRLQEFGLFARKQHAVYAELYKRYRIAVSRQAGLIGLTSMPDFSKWKLREAEKYFASVNIHHPRAEEAKSLFAREKIEEAARLMRQIEHDMRVVRADQAFDRAKRYEAVEELYFSDEVRDQVEIVRGRIADFSAAMMERDDGYVDPNPEKRPSALSPLMEEAAIKLFHVMRTELQRGAKSSSAA